ncbi:MAG: CHAT domain-containing protein [Prochloraceae cyanobacterium]
MNAPLAGQLKRNKISEIIFISDGILRNVPMEALTTNEGKYLLEEYAIAYQIGLKSLDFKIPRQAPTSLLAGTSEFLLPFQSLAEIAKEIKIVSKLVNNPAILLNKEFTESNLKTSLQNNNHSIIHLATHGIFEGSAENSFLLTYDEKIPLDELTDLLLLSQEPIGLLVLTACETAEGSELAPLGIAGTGVRAGAANILATLWEINDLQTVLFVEEFYRQLNQGKSIAKAKQAAQLSQKEQHPGYWASFIHFQFETDQN